MVKPSVWFARFNVDRRGERHVLDVGDLRIAAAGEARTHLQGVGIGPAIEQGVVLSSVNDVVAAARTDTVRTEPPVMVSAPDEPVIVKPSVWLARLNATAVVSVTFSMLAICASLLLVKFAPTCRVSVPAPPSSSVSFCAPTMVSCCRNQP